MPQGSLSHYSAFSKLLLSAGIVLASLFVATIIGSIVAILFFNLNMFSATPDVMSQNINFLKFYQAIYSFGMFVLPPFALAYLFSKNPVHYLFLQHQPGIKKLLLASVIVLVSLPAINLLAQVNSHFSLPDFLSGIENWMKQAEEQAKIITDKLLASNSVADLWVNLLIIAVLPAIGEELLFRGVLQKIFVQWTKNLHWGIAITAFLFASFHMQFYGLLPRMAMGILFGYLLVWSHSIWLPIVVHFINNGLAVVTRYYIDRGYISEEVENIGSQPNEWVFGVFSLLVALFLLLGLKRLCKRKL